MALFSEMMDEACALQVEIEWLRAGLAGAIETMEEIRHGTIAPDGPTVIAAISAARRALSTIEHS